MREYPIKPDIMGSFGIFIIISAFAIGILFNILPGNNVDYYTEPCKIHKYNGYIDNIKVLNNSKYEVSITTYSDKMDSSTKKFLITKNKLEMYNFEQKYKNNNYIDMYGRCAINELLYTYFIHHENNKNNFYYESPEIIIFNLNYIIFIGTGIFLSIIIIISYSVILTNKLVINDYEYVQDMKMIYVLTLLLSTCAILILAII